MKALLFAALAMPLSLLLTGAFLRLSRARLLDVPGPRSSHVQPTPTGGGLGPVSAIALAQLCMLLVVPVGLDWMLVTVLGCVLAAVGFADDIHRLKVLPRLLAQGAAALALVLLLGRLHGAGTALFVAVATQAAMVLLLVWLVNTFNFMDGIDGIAGGQALFMALCASALAFLAGAAADTVAMLAAIAAASAGFLYWNWPPARLFMGDAGSLGLGFLLAGATCITSSRGELPVVVWVILWAPFLCDVTLTLLHRSWCTEPLHLAHREHAYQRLARDCAGHRPVSLALQAANWLWLAPLAVAALRYPERAGPLAAAALLPFASLVLFMQWRERHALRER